MGSEAVYRHMINYVPPIESLMRNDNEKDDYGGYYSTKRMRSMGTLLVFLGLFEVGRTETYYNSGHIRQNISCRHHTGFYTHKNCKSLLG